MNELVMKLRSGVLLKDPRMRTILLAIAFTAAFCIFVTANLFAGSLYVPEDTVQELNSERSQVYVDGTGYVLDNYTKKQNTENEEQPSMIQEEEPEEEEEKEEKKKPEATSPYTRRYNTNTTTPSYRRPTYTRPSTTRPTTQPKKQTTKKEKKKKEKESQYNKEKEEIDVRPTIKISGVKKGATVKGTVKKFKVTATSYDGDDITGSKLVVKMNGVRLVASGSSYKGEVLDGSNKIEVTAEDGEGNKRSKSVTFKGVTEKKPEIIGQLSVLVTADVLGLGEIVSEDSVDIYDNEQLSDVVQRYFENSGVTAKNTGSGYYYLGHIKIDGVLDDIPEEILQELEEKGIEVPDNKDSLGEGDFGAGSGWMYKVGSTTPNKYMDEMDPKVDSRVEIYYTISGM